MESTTTGSYRVLASPRGPDEWLLLDVASAEPTYVDADDVPGAVDLASGNRVEATVAWRDDRPVLTDCEVAAATRFRFARTEAPLFEAAVDCWADGDGDMNAQVTYSNDREPVGVVYTFPAQPGQRDLFVEFRDGTRPLEPLVARASEAAEPPFSVYVLDPLDRPFVVVYVVLALDSVLDRTVRDTYL